MQECVGETARQQLGNYRLSHLLGSGGFAEVYLGEHVYLKTQAAIKVLEMKLANEALESFLGEARTIARLEHPNIVHVLEFGMEGQTPFLVMSYAPHGTLRQRYPRGTILPPTTILPYVKQIASALQYAHDKKLIHRDVKPENMLLGANNEVLLSDFGLAIVARSANSIHLQDRAGTIDYMAPEQLEGKPSAASDQYALGVVVYEWLSGDVPFHGLDLQVALQHMEFQPRALREKVPTISPAIERVVMKALAKDPLHRFKSVQDFATAFEQACSSELSVYSTPTFPHPLHRNTPAAEVHNTPAAPHPFTPKPVDIPKPGSPHTPSPLSTPILPPGPLNTPKPSILDREAGPHQRADIGPDSVPHLPNRLLSLPFKASPAPMEHAVGPAESTLSVPSPINSLPTRPSPLSHPDPVAPSQRRFTRRKVVTGLAGLTALGIAGGIGWLAVFQKPQTLSSGQAGSSTSTARSGSIRARASTPTNQPPVVANLNTPTSVASPAPTQAETSSPTPVPTTPDPTALPKLTLEFVNPPAQVRNNSEVIVNVKASESNVTATLHASYTVPPNTYDSGMQQTDGQGNAALVWQVQVLKSKHDTTTATVTVSGVDQSGQPAQTAPITVTIR